ncbi:hypothetical protein WCLP8_4920002 [uncultured Gammaproteobacteria bacterium]
MVSGVPAAACCKLSPIQHESDQIVILTSAYSLRSGAAARLFVPQFHGPRQLRSLGHMFGASIG